MRHNYTLQQLRDIGINSKSIPSSVLGGKKFDTSGNFTKAKGRWVVTGTKKNVQKGIHFNETFASTSTPSTATTRVMQAMAVGHNLYRHAFDISAAFLWASREPELIAIKYPPGFRRFHPDTKEELFIVV